MAKNQHFRPIHEAGLQCPPTQERQNCRSEQDEERELCKADWPLPFLTPPDRNLVGQESDPGQEQDARRSHRAGNKQYLADVAGTARPSAQEHHEGRYGKMEKRELGEAPRALLSFASPVGDLICHDGSPG